MRIRRRRGATLGFVAIIVLVIIILGVGFFVLTKLLGGGREVANSVDAGTLNVAKQAFLEPSKAAREFTNPDVATNFELLSPDGKFRLENYNRLVAQAMIVALNAKDEDTSAAASNARKVWDALNDVAKFLRTNHGSSAVMGGYFQDLAGANNLKMMGQNGISLNGYDVAYTARGESTNVYVNPLLLSTFAASSLPLSTGTVKSPTGHKFMAGYTPLAVPLSSGTLVFSGVPVNPQDRPHLISGFTFDGGKNPAFMPGYPAEVLPPNSFRSAGQTKESHTQTFGGAVASAIVGSLNREYEATIPNGYIEIKNGPDMGPPTGDVAYYKKDVFCHSLAGLGIDVSPNDKWFCRGSDNQVATGDIKAYDTALNKVPDQNTIANDILENSPLLPGQSPTTPFETAVEITNAVVTWDSKNLINRWVDVNKMSVLARSWCRRHNIPNCELSLKYIRHGNGDPAIDCREFEALTEYTDCECHWQQYGKDFRKDDQSSRCVRMLPNFKRGYNETGSSSLNDSGHGFTAMEAYKCAVLEARKDCTTCKTVYPTKEESGVKWFAHKVHYAAPDCYHNFSSIGSPKTLLEHIDKAPKADGCAQTSIIDFLHKRCQQIKPIISRNEVVDALSKADLPLGKTLYMYVKDGSLVMNDQKPIGAVANTLPDGKGAKDPKMACGTPYNVIGTQVNTTLENLEIIGYGPDFYQNDKKRQTMIAKHGIRDSDKNSFSDMPEVRENTKRVWVDPPGSTSTADKYPYKTEMDPNVDGSFPGWAFRQASASTCTDKATWIPSTGYNNLLGQLYFTNTCEGGGQFCQPN